MKQIKKVLLIFGVIVSVVLGFDGHVATDAMDDQEFRLSISQEELNLALQTSIPQVIQILKESPEDYDIARGSQLKLGAPFEIANLNQPQGLNTSTIVYFPIIAEHEIAAFTTVVKIDGQLLFGDIIDNYASHFNDLLSRDTKQQYTLVSYPGESIYAISEEGDVFKLSDESIQTTPDVALRSGDPLSVTNHITNELNRVSWEKSLGHAITDAEIIALYNPDAMSAYIDNRTSGKQIPSEYLHTGLNLYEEVRSNYESRN